MLCDPQERFVVSSIGWVDHGALWVFDANTAGVRLFKLSDAKYLSLHAGEFGHYAVVHHYDGDRLEVTAHSFDDPCTVLSRALVSGSDWNIEGPLAPWTHLPRHYVAYLTQPSWSDFALVSIDSNRGLTLQTFEWFDDSYDKGYQGIIGVIEVPLSDIVLVSVQRSSKVIIHSPQERRKVGEFELSGRGGNPRLQFRRRASELWADDYDTLIKIQPKDWRITRHRRLQESEAGTAQFIGQFSFDVNESLCVVARPFSGDVVAVDPDTLGTKFRSRIGGQPIETALLRNRRVIARDWKSGNLLQGELGRAWFT